MAVFAAFAFASTGAQATNLLVNGSFEEAANFQAGSHVGDDELSLGSTAMPGWTVIGGGSLLGWFSNANTYGVSASDGSYSLDVTGDTDSSTNMAGVQQGLFTYAGAHYVLTFDLGSHGSYGVPAGITASAGGSSQAFESNLTNGGQNVWATQTFSFVGTGAFTQITLQGSAGGQYVGLDNVSLTSTDAPVGTALPEPATWAMMMLGFGGLGGLLRRRRAFGLA